MLRMAKNFAKILFFVLSLCFMSCSLLFIISQINFFLLSFSIIGLAAFTSISAWKLSSFFSDYIYSTHVNPVGKVVVVTGCDTGFGHELALRLDSLGFHVYATCLDVESKGAVELITRCSSRLTLMKMNVSNDQEIRLVVEEIKTRVTTMTDGLKLWAVVNNSGISNFSAVEWGSSTDEIFTKVLMVNVIGSVKVTRSFLPLLKQTSKSRVIFMSSIAGRISFPAMVPYSISKFAIRAFSDGLRRELESTTVSVSMIEPAMFKTPLTERTSCMKNLEKNFCSTSDESKRFISPAEVDYINSKVNQYLKSVNGNPDYVIRQMIRSVVDLHPKISYTVYGSFTTHVMLKVLELMPPEMQDFILSDSVLRIFKKKIQIN